MENWQTIFLGLKQLPRELSAFEIEAFFTFSEAERATIAARRRPALQLGLALQIGFLRMSGRLLDALRIVPPALWRHLGAQLSITPPELASLRALYQRAQTLREHHQIACKALGFRWASEHERLALLRAIREELARTGDRNRLLRFARQWMYEYQLIIVHERQLRSMIDEALHQFETELSIQVRAAIDEPLRRRWHKETILTHESGLTLQNWLWAAPAKHSTRQIGEMFGRIGKLYELDVHCHLQEVPEALLRRYATRLANRSPSVGARMREPARSVEVAYFLRYCLLLNTDRLLWMVRRRISDLWRRAAADAVKVQIHWMDLYRELLASLGTLVSDMAVPDVDIRQRLQMFIKDHQERKPPTHAQLIRAKLIDEVTPVRALLKTLTDLPWAATDNHPVMAAMTLLQGLYAQNQRQLPADISLEFGSVWNAAVKDDNRERAFKALEVATLSGVHRALRNGSVWIEHSLAFRGRERLFIPEKRWENEHRAHYGRLGLPLDAKAFLDPMIERAKSGIAAVARAAQEGLLAVDDELHLPRLEAEEEDPKVTELRTMLDQRIGEAQLPDLILSIDAEVRFSWIMLGREPRSHQELLMAYAGILAHGTAMSAAETARMIPGLTAEGVRQAMRWASDEHRLREASRAVLTFMHRHPITQAWGRSDLASSDMMSLDTSKRVWQARIDPRRQQPGIGVYSHVRDRWGIFYAKPIVINERQAGAAIEGAIREEEFEVSRLATDTHGWTDFAMWHGRTVGVDLCPRIKALSDRHLYLPRGSEIPEILKPICHATLDLTDTALRWDEFVHLAASVESGFSSPVNVLRHFGAAARGDSLYDAGVQGGRLLRTIFLCDYFVNPVFRRELLRVLNRGEATNTLKRAIYIGRVAAHQAKREEEMQAVADALSLLANIVMAWNTVQMQRILGSENVPSALIGRIAPTHIEGLNLRGIFRFPIEEYAEQLLPTAIRKSVKQGY